MRRLYRALFLAGMLCAFFPIWTDPKQDFSPAHNQYELRYLGCPVKPDSFHEHTGIFLFIWKGEKPIYVLGYATPDRRRINPFASFSLHQDAIWKPVGEWCGTGAQWLKVQPGQVMTFKIGMGWIEHDSPGWTVEGADEARFNLMCAQSDTGKNEGAISSDEFSRSQTLEPVPIKWTGIGIGED